ncbi:FxsA family protein [Tabrizicola sp.]|uniref:FxsA family protein n=1 Tax=Tabrizicola sp. TaxID=2005166 RepID=UPI003F2F607E
MWIFLLILAVPLVEIALFVTLGGAIGLWPTLAWVLVSAALGIFVLKRVAVSGAVSLRQDMREMRDPLSPLAHRAILVMAAVLLLLPGFFTDALGLLLLLKPVRLGVIALIARRIRVVPMGGTATADVIEGDWSEVKDSDLPPRRDQPSGWTRH